MKFCGNLTYHCRKRASNVHQMHFLSLTVPHILKMGPVHHEYIKNPRSSCTPSSLSIYRSNKDRLDIRASMVLPDREKITSKGMDFEVLVDIADSTTVGV